MNNLIKYIKRFRILKFIIERVAYLWFGFWHILFYFFKVNQKKIVITNFYGKGYGDNPKYIVEELLKKDLNLDIVWIVNDLNYKLPKGIRKCKKYSVKSIYEFMTAKIWIDNCRKYYFYNIFKKSSTVYIQTWHAGVGLKKSEKDVEKELNKSYIISAKKDSKMVNYFLSGSEWQTQYIKKNFWMNKKILNYGLPRNDIFFMNYKNYKQKVIAFYNLDTNINILLYAPTFRKNNTSILLELKNLKDLINPLRFKFGGKWIIFVRLHPNISEMYIDLSENVINVSRYEDVQELLIASNILVTDYSSIMFDMLLLDKPVFIYANDILEYANDRDYTFKFNELPFPLAENKKDLLENIKKFNLKLYNDKSKIFKKKLGSFEDGHACERVCKLIENIIDGKVQK